MRCFREAKKLCYSASWTNRTLSFETAAASFAETVGLIVASEEAKEWVEEGVFAAVVVAESLGSPSGWC